jgi:hypothetical protein
VPRLLSAAMIASKNAIDGAPAWTVLFEIAILGAPVPYRLANYSEDIVFHGLLFQRFPCDLDSLEDANSTALVNLRVTAQNVDQQLQSLLETYWVPVQDPQWNITLWQIDPTIPNETAFGQGELFTVESVRTDFFTAQFALVAEGLTLTTIVPKRRYTKLSGFQNMPRR